MPEPLIYQSLCTLNADNLGCINVRTTNLSMSCLCTLNADNLGCINVRTTNLSMSMHPKNLRLELAQIERMMLAAFTKSQVGIRAASFDCLGFDVSRTTARTSSSHFFFSFFFPV